MLSVHRFSRAWSPLAVIWRDGLQYTNTSYIYPVQPTQSPWIASSLTPFQTSPTLPKGFLKQGPFVGTRYQLMDIMVSTRIFEGGSAFAFMKTILHGRWLYFLLEGRTHPVLSGFLRFPKPPFNLASSFLSRHSEMLSISRKVVAFNFPKVNYVLTGQGEIVVCPYETVSSKSTSPKR